MTINSMRSINEPNIKDIDEQDQELSCGDEHQAKVRQKIDELLEKKRLRDLLDDSDDW